MVSTTGRPKTALIQPGQIPLVYLDANVLFPQNLRSTFLDLADAGLIRVYWGSKVLGEVRRNLIASAFGRTVQQADAFPDAMVPGSETLESHFSHITDQ
ncbi:PIN domain-containing protein [Allopusillimonas ginsengisoli]|nr:PIN domain-containing protein [Allopusillimonas ginsengisoli]